MNLIASGGITMYPLILCSIIAVAVIFERCIYWLLLSAGSKAQSLPQSFDQISTLPLDDRKVRKDPIMRVVTAFLLQEKNQSTNLVKIEINSIQESMTRNMKVLDTLISVAPMFGILGTVIGMIISFNMVGGSSNIDPNVAMAGISQAFISTGAGLVISILCLIAHNFFAAKVSNVQVALRKALLQLEDVSDAK